MSQKGEIFVNVGWQNGSEKIEHWSKKQTMLDLLLIEVTAILSQTAVNQQNDF